MRAVLVLLAMFLLYFLIPVAGFNANNPTGAWIRLLAVIVVFLTILVLQLRFVLFASAPQIRAVEAVVESVVAFVLLFAWLYVSLSTTEPAYFSELLDKVDALYFTSSTFSTVGFGDIVATSKLTRGLVSIQMISGLGVLALTAKAAFLMAQKAESRRP
ncbi:hypothetical protein GCM10023166_34550 [Paeniglutamicibacter cryotolerans]